MNIQVSAKTFTSAADIMANAVAVHKRLLNPGKLQPATAKAFIAKPLVETVEAKRQFLLRAHDEHVKAWQRWRACAGTPLRNYIYKRCDELGVTYEDIVGHSRLRRFVYPRHLIMWEIKKRVKPDISYPELGRLFGGRDHTSILHSVRKISKLVDAKRQHEG